jgi:hypothetical protein
MELKTNKEEYDAKEILKYIIYIGGILYTLGLIITLEFYFSKGIFVFDFLYPQYILTGGMFSIIIFLSSLPFLVIKQQLVIKNLRNRLSLKRHKFLQKVILEVLMFVCAWIVFCLILFVLLNNLFGDGKRHPEPLKGFVYLIIINTVIGFLTNGTNRIFLLLPNNVLALREEIMPSSLFRNGFKAVFWIMCISFVTMTYTNTVYKFLPANIAGGEPLIIKLILPKAYRNTTIFGILMPLDTNQSITTKKLYLVKETQDSYYIFTDSNATSVTQVPKRCIDAAIIWTVNDGY